MKKKVFLGVFYMVLSLSLFIGAAFLAEYKVISEGVGAFLILVCFVPLWFSCVYVSKIDIALHIFRCQSCGHGFKPTLKEYICGPHTLKKRRLRCPKCGETTWCPTEREKKNPQI